MAAKNIEDALSKAFKANKQIEESFKAFSKYNQLSDHFEKLNSLYQPHIDKFKVFVESSPAYKAAEQTNLLWQNKLGIQQWESLTAPLDSFYQKMYGSGYMEVLERFQKQQEAAERFITNFPEALKLLAKYGWYTRGDNCISHINDWIRLAQAGDATKLDSCMVEHYRDEYNEIEVRLSTALPERAHIIQQAFQAHTAGLYYCSVPLFLSLADGICNGLLFMTKKQKEALRRLLTERVSYSDTVLKILDAVLEKTTIDDSCALNQSYFEGLNRHAVMHGSDIHYGTEVNSFKALSLLCFISDYSLAKLGQIEHEEL